MPRIWTEEQDTFFDAVLTQAASIIVVEAVAGSAKSSSVTEAIKRWHKLKPDLKAEYTVFGAANAAEASAEFGHTCKAMNIHKKAARATLKEYGLKLPIVDYITWRDIPKSAKIPTRFVSDAIRYVDDFCISEYTSLRKYTHSLPKKMSAPMFKAVNSILGLIADGKINTTHSFYLKLYHILVMNDTIILPELDVLIADEAGDMTQISLDIFNKSPAKMKIIIGDSSQSVFGFMNLVSAFDYYKGQGLHLTLSKSFRVNANDAKLVQAFCRDTFEPDMIFEGMHYKPNHKIITSAYITRTNSALISQMIELESHGIPFRLSSKTKISQLFLWPLALIYLKPGNAQYNQNLKHLQADADEWGRSTTLQATYSLRTYILRQNEFNKAIQAAHTLLMTYTPEEVLTAYRAADSHLTSNAPHILMTAHTSKGLTMDSVTLDDDINTAVNKVLIIPAEDRTPDEIETLKLCYIAATRHRHELHNARFLDKYREPINEH